MNYIDAQSLSFKYDRETVLEDISLHVAPGELVILTGENGAAKSTLLRLLLGMLKPLSGKAVISQSNRFGHKLVTGYVPQQVAAFNAGFPTTVEEFVRSGRFPQGRWFKRLTAEDHAHIEKALESVNMTDFRKKRIGSLSGGQKQRICLARMFACDPDLLILDEPSTAMDKASRDQFYQLLQHEAHAHQKAILMVTHDSDDLTGIADRQIHLVRKEDVPWRCFSLDSCSAHSSAHS
ncbi:metal ABC transporter ATP-binding protein [Listeria costaricensis]|uniref:metal ABC transporter ATP-binding protein n=1 Tax=Listeria costaricensis TaxID=2026604 RepID=UPI000C070213|nr:metal ABC transporter ATP-binding protein [Listeria costaricensis]